MLGFPFSILGKGRVFQSLHQVRVGFGVVPVSSLLYWHIQGAEIQINLSTSTYIERTLFQKENYLLASSSDNT